MITSTLNPRVELPTATKVKVTENVLSVELSDGRRMSVPLSWYPRLSHALPEHRASWQFIGQGHGIHWPQLDEDISIDNLLLGQPSAEGARSFSRWKEWYQKKRIEQCAPADAATRRG